MSADNKALQDRVSREMSSHTDNDVLAESYKLKNRFSHIWSYPSRVEFDKKFDQYFEDIKSLTVLDYGCGNGNKSFEYLKKGAVVEGIDISENYINNCKRQAAENGFPPCSYRFQVMDAHALDFPDNKFDIVAGNGILHHLDAEIALSEIYRVLKPGGRVLLQEPLAGNPLLKLFRALTPKARTVDERPFAGTDLDLLINSERWVSESVFCGCIEAPVAVITSILFRKNPNNALLKIAHKFESFLERKAILRSWNQYVLFNLIKK